MILVATLFFLLVLLLPHLVVAAVGTPREGPADIFGPLRMLTYLGLSTVPYLVILCFDTGRLTVEARSSPWVQDPPAGIIRYVMLASAGYLVMVLGLFAPAGGWIARRLPVLHERRFTRARCRRAFLLCAAVGLPAYGWFLHGVGGLRQLWVNMALRTDLLAGQGYLFNLYTLLLTFAPLLLVYSLRFERSLPRVAAVVLAVVAAGAILSSTGGRMGAITLAIYAFMTAHYGVRRFRRLVTKWTVLIVAVFLVFFTALPLFRTADAFEVYSENPELLAQQVGRSFGNLAWQFSSLDRGLVITGYFTRDRLWWGRSYADLLAAPVPRRGFLDKPPVDEGMYVTALAYGNHVRPPTPARQLPATSLPPGNWALFMNFGVPGLFLGMYLTGIGIAAAYRYMWASGRTPLTVYLYGYAVLGGMGFSNYLIVQGIVTVTMAALVFVPLFGRWPWPAPGRAPARVEGAA